VREFGVTLCEPFGDGAVELIEMPRKKMVRVFHKHQTVFSQERRDEFFYFSPGTVLIVGAMDKEFGLRATPEVGEIGAVHRDTKAN